MTELRSAAGETLEFEVGPVERDEPAIDIVSSISGLVTTAAEHGYAEGDHVRLQGHLWNPINGAWVVASVESSTSFVLSGASTSSSGGQTGQVVKVAAIDLTAANTQVLFAAKRNLSDPAAFVEKAYGVAGKSGIGVDQPPTARKNLATVRIAPEDTEDVASPEDFYFDVWLIEPDGRATRLDRGIWKIGAAVAV